MSDFREQHVRTTHHDCGQFGLLQTRSQSEVTVLHWQCHPSKASLAFLLKLHEVFSNLHEPRDLN